ncbi:MAG: TetM/TetW/TetO/TetS family tetracycline resistance ribosomal protection protein [Eubacterium sp.]|nr:TetM/TetW/TetO/TetS family tetracycline resistance ribosomal protection protein [Eubacterium sp.]
MKKITVGLIANVDAGKTTLSEALLYSTGMRRQFGRVDKQESFLDSNDIERKRGITVFSKVAKIEQDDTRIYLLDTPGHADFTAETERALDALDYAVMIISGISLVTERDKVLLRLLDSYNVPVFIFVNKMDISPYDISGVHESLSAFDDRIIDFTGVSSFADRDVKDKDSLYESIAERDINALEEYSETGSVSDETIREAVYSRSIIPYIYGSALKLEGILELISIIKKYSYDIYSLENDITADDSSANDITDKSNSAAVVVSARVFKIIHDNRGERISFLKITEGKLSVRDELIPGEKVSQIRAYSGDRFESVQEAFPGDIIGITGLKSTFPGMGIGAETDFDTRNIEPFLKYRILPPSDMSCDTLMQSLSLIADEDPMLCITHDREQDEILVRLMGAIQLEILQSEVKSRFGIDISFAEGSIEYKETIADKAYGVGHFEPLRHYAEVHVLLTPLPTGSGIVVDSRLSENILGASYQKNVESAISIEAANDNLVGKLTGSPLTDIRITLVQGKSHVKHTEGGDMREAALRAVRQAVMKSESILLEPYLEYDISVPDEMVGKVMNDMTNRFGTCEIDGKYGDKTRLRGAAPYTCIRNYQEELSGRGTMNIRFLGYLKCHNQDEVIAETGYIAERDTKHPAGSIFCSHGSGVYVEWDEVDDRKAVPFSVLAENKVNDHFEASSGAPQGGSFDYDMAIGLSEIDAIIERSAHANDRGKNEKRRFHYEKSRQKVDALPSKGASKPKPVISREKIYLIDGYNLIHAWPDLKSILMNENVTGARDLLIERMSDFHAITGTEVLIVFDAYKVAGHETEVMTRINVHVVYTREAETADQYIGRFATLKSRIFDITVITNDGMVQLITRGKDAYIMSSNDFINYYNERTGDFKDEFLGREY